MAIQIGSTVRQVAPVIEGEVVDIEYDKDNSCLKHLVQYVDSDGETQTRWFTEVELNETAPPVVVAATTDAETGTVTND